MKSDPWVWALVAAGLMAGVALALPAIGDEPFLSAVPVLFGWISFLKRACAEATFDRTAVISSGICLLLVTLGIHWVCSWLYRSIGPQGITRRWPFRWTFTMSAGLVLIFAAGISTVALAHQALWLARSPRPLHKDSAREISCARNMRQIGEALLAYANGHRGHLPDTLEQLCLTSDLSPELFVCPQSADRPAEGETLSQWVTQLSAPGHLSYVYVGRDTTISDAHAVLQPILYEHADNHDGECLNVLFADGHVEDCRTHTLQELLDHAKAATMPSSPEPLTDE